MNSIIEDKIAQLTADFEAKQKEFDEAKGNIENPQIK